MENAKSYQELLKALEEAKFQLEEANDTIDAIRSGGIDALIVKNDNGHQIYTLKNADQTYRIFIEQMTEGAITLNRNGHILYSNSQFASLVGLPLEKVVGQPFYRFIKLDDRNFWDALIVRAWDRDTRGELLLSASQNGQIPVLLSLKTLNLDEGLSMSVILTDLTEQKETQKLLQQKNAELEEAQRTAQHLNATLEKTVRERTKDLEINIQEKSKVEEELRSNQERLTQILETMAEGVGIIDAKGNLTYANPMAQKILGIIQNERVEKTYEDPKWQNLRVDGTLLPDSEHPMVITMSTGQPVYDYEISVQPPDKERFYISVNAAPVRDEKGNIIAGIGTFMDVTNRRKAIQQKDDFISVASHELRTPVTSLKASLQLLNRIKDQPLSLMFPRLIEQANKSLNKVSVLIEDLLNVTKMTEGQLHLNKKLVTLSELIDDSCQHVRTTGVHSIITEGDLDLQVYADADKIEQVIVNLVNNAVKYAANSREIIISVKAVDKMAKIAVADKGPGIPPEKLPHLFDRYYRVDSNGAQYSGLGLGLYICSQIIKKHDGQIGAESDMGQGSTFWFTLKL